MPFVNEVKTAVGKYNFAVFKSPSVEFGLKLFFRSGFFVGGEEAFVKKGFEGGFSLFDSSFQWVLFIYSCELKIHVKIPHTCSLTPEFSTGLKSGSNTNATNPAKSINIV